MAAITENKECKVPFKVDVLSRHGSDRVAHIVLTKSGTHVSALIPKDVRYAFGSVVRWLSTDEAQNELIRALGPR